MKIALVSAAWPPVRCGVGDYSSRLAEALENEGVGVIRFGAEPRRFDTLAAPAAARCLAATGADIVHIQYPTVGYNRSLLPAALPLLLRHVPVVVTLHEFSIFRFYRWPWFAPFAYAASAVVFTNAAEAAAFTRRMPGFPARTATIPIGSNIPHGAAAVRDPLAVCYFGLLMPGKGIEEFLDLAARLKDAQPAWRCILIGAIFSGSEDYAETVIASARAVGVTLHVGLEACAVADLLQGIGYAYLPGPGGISERRGSVLAALENGVQVIGPVNAATPPWMRDQVRDAASPAEAHAVLVAHAGEVPASRQTLTSPATSWSNIALRHKALYETICGRVAAPQ